MRECRLEQVGAIFSQNRSIRGLVRVEQWSLDDVHFYKLEHAGQKDTLKFETALMVRVRENKEGILDDAQEILLEEGIANRGLRCPCKVVDNLQAHCVFMSA